MTAAQKKNWGLEFIRTVGTIIVASLIMGFIMKPEANKIQLEEIEKDQIFVKQRQEGVLKNIDKFDQRITNLENLMPGLATKTDIQILKEDLIRELKR